MDEKTGLALDLVELEDTSVEELLSLAEGIEVFGVPYEIFFHLPVHLSDLVKLLPFPIRLSLAYVRKGLEEGTLKLNEKGVVEAVDPLRRIPVSLSAFEQIQKGQAVLKCFKKVFLGKEAFYQVDAKEPETFGKRTLSYLLPAFSMVSTFLVEDWNYLFVGDGSCLAYILNLLSGEKLKERITILDIDEDVVRAYREMGFRAYPCDLRFAKDFVFPGPYHFIYTYHIEFYQTEAILSFVRANLHPYGIWFSYITPYEHERSEVFTLLRFIEKSGMILTGFIWKYFSATKIPDPERRLLWREK